MTTADLIEHFGTGTAVAMFLGIKPSAVYQWGDYPPYSRQCEIELKTHGALKAENNLKEAI